MQFPATLLNMIRSPGVTGLPAEPIVAQAASKATLDPSAAITPLVQAGPLIAFWLSARVLSAVKMVIMSEAGAVVPSGLVTAGPRLAPGSIAGRMTLHPALFALGPSNTRFRDAGGRFTRPPVLHCAAFVVFGIGIPPAGIPVLV